MVVGDPGLICEVFSFGTWQNAKNPGGDTPAHMEAKPRASTSNQAGSSYAMCCKSKHLPNRKCSTFQLSGALFFLDMEDARSLASRS